MHRLAFEGEDDSEFCKIGSRLVIAASIPLAVGISSDVAVVFFKTTESTAAALGAGAAALFALLGFWLAYPFWHPRSLCGAMNPPPDALIQEDHWWYAKASGRNMKPELKPHIRLM